MSTFVKRFYAAFNKKQLPNWPANFIYTPGDNELHLDGKFELNELKHLVSCFEEALKPEPKVIEAQVTGEVTSYIEAIDTYRLTFENGSSIDVKIAGLGEIRGMDLIGMPIMYTPDYQDILDAIGSGTPYTGYNYGIGY